MIGTDHLGLDWLDLAHPRHRLDVKAGAHFRERRAALEGTGPIGGGESKALQTKTPGSLSQAGLRDGPFPHQGCSAHQVSRPLNPTSVGLRAGDTRGLSSRCSRLQIAKGAGLKRRSLQG